jgi:hypothetical protein
MGFQKVGDRYMAAEKNKFERKRFIKIYSRVCSQDFTSGNIVNFLK